MLQIIALVLGVVAVVMGIKGCAARRVQLSSKTTLQGPQAVLAGAITIVVGLGIIAFALMIPVLYR